MRKLSLPPVSSLSRCGAVRLVALSVRWPVRAAWGHGAAGWLLEMIVASFLYLTLYPDCATVDTGSSGETGAVADETLDGTVPVWGGPIN